MRKCRNWQTSKTKDLVINAIVWVQVPSSAVGKSLEIKGFFLFHKKVASVYKGTKIYPSPTVLPLVHRR